MLNEWVSNFWLVIRPLPRKEHIIHIPPLVEMKIQIPHGWHVVKEGKTKRDDKLLKFSIGYNTTYFDEAGIICDVTNNLCVIRKD